MQDARGFFLIGIVFGFLLWLWVWLVFLSVLSCFVLVDCFWLCVDSFSVCVPFDLAFRFALSLVLYPFLLLSRYVPYPFRSMARKKRGGTQVQIASLTDRPLVRYRSNCCMEGEWAVPEESDE